MIVYGLCISLQDLYQKSLNTYLCKDLSCEAGVLFFCCSCLFFEILTILLYRLLYRLFYRQLYRQRYGQRVRTCTHTHSPPYIPPLSLSIFLSFWLSICLSSQSQRKPCVHPCYQYRVSLVLVHAWQLRYACHLLQLVLCYLSVLASPAFL